MPTDRNLEQEKVELKLDIVLAKGFNCHVCSSTRFSFNGMGLIFCNECGITYQVDVLKKYINEENK